MSGYFYVHLENEKDRLEFLEIAELAKERSESLKREDEKEIPPSVGPFAWNNISSFMKGKDGGNCDESLIENEWTMAGDENERQIKNMASRPFVD